jgi:hypothetical protein
MSITLTHYLAQMTQKAAQTSPVFWIAAAAMLILVVLGCTVSPASFNNGDAQIKTMPVGP